MPGTVRVDGLHELQAAFAKFEPDTRRAFRGGLRRVAEPVRQGAEALAQSNIRRIGPRWSKMRIGINRDLVYVAPRQRGVKTRGRDPRRRPNLAGLLMDRAMEPSLTAHAGEVEARMGVLLDIVVDQFNHGGP